MKRKWESSATEKYAENYWDNKGYLWDAISESISKTVYKVSKDGISIEYSIPRLGGYGMWEYHI